MFHKLHAGHLTNLEELLPVSRSFSRSVARLACGRFGVVVSKLREMAPVISANDIVDRIPTQHYLLAAIVGGTVSVFVMLATVVICACCKKQKHNSVHSPTGDVEKSALPKPTEEPPPMVPEPPQEVSGASAATAKPPEQSSSVAPSADQAMSFKLMKFGFMISGCLGLCHARPDFLRLVRFRKKHMLAI